jgi:hypothetical protein
MAGYNAAEMTVLTTRAKMSEDDFDQERGGATALEHSVRLLYPFWIEPGGLDRMVRALCLRHHAGHKQEFTVWQEAGRISDWYREEILPLVAQVLFGIRSGANRYLRVAPETLSHWFPQGGVFESGAADGEGAGESANAARAAYPLDAAGEGVELFLTPHGVGLLSLSFRCAEAAGLKHLQALNCRLSQLCGAAYRYRLPYDSRSTYPEPGPHDPFEQRLGVGGGAFTLRELVDFLLAPLNVFGLLETQQQFSVYSVTRFDQQALFTDAACQARLRPFLAALAHVEEATDQGSLGLRERLLSPRHWAAVGSLGAAHLVADQKPPSPLDQQRLPRSLYKYFVPYLCASLQRLTLQRLLWETDSAVLETDSSLHERQAKLRILHQDMLRFSVQGCFTEISSREVHNQYYELALEGLRVPATLQLVQRVLRDMESATTAAFQQETVRETQALAHDVGANVGLMADMRQKVEWLAVFFVSFYATALVHYVGGGFFDATYTHWSLVATPFMAGLVALRCVKPYQTREASSAKAPNKAAWLFCGIISALFLAWVGVGWQCFPAKAHGVENPDVLCASEANCEPGANEGTI